MNVYKSWAEVNAEIGNRLNSANIFYTENYEKFERLRNNSCLYVSDERGIVLIVIRQKYLFKWGEMPSEPFYFQGEVDEQEYLDNVMDILPSYVSWLAQSGTAANFISYPTKSKRIPFGNYIIDLTQDEETLFSNMTGKCRNMIRRAKKDAVNILSGKAELLDEYMIVDAKTWERSGQTKDFRKLYKCYLDSLGENVRIYLAKKDNVLQGGAIFIMNKNMSYYMFGASVDKPSPGALNLLQWQAMLDFKNRGVHSHNFVGCRINEDPDSKYHGIQQFKRSFGGSLEQGYMFKKIFNLMSYRLFQEAVKLKLKLHGEKSLGDIIDQEIHKWADLNE